MAGEQVARRTGEVIELEDDVLQGGNVAHGGRDGADQVVLSHIKVSQVLQSAQALREGALQLVGGEG